MPSPSVTIIIPARLGSSRFPGKVLADRTGMPLIQHVHEAVSRATCASSVVVAVDDQRVAEVVRGFGGRVVMTSVAHPNGTSRLAEAATLLGLGPDEVVVNAQGDEPELDPTLIDAAVETLVRTGAPMATVATPMDPARMGDPNVVKVVCRNDGRALYFSRAPIPFVRDTSSAGDRQGPLRHIGIYAYRRSFLGVYADLPETALERTEMLEQLRALAYGHEISVAIREDRGGGGIDTPEQYEAFVTRWRAGRDGATPS